MKILDILKRAAAVIDKLPDRKVSPNSVKSYRKTFARMWREPELDALAPGIALDTYYARRAALHWTGRRWLMRLCARCWAAAQRQDIAAVQRWTAILFRILARIEPALERDPPLATGFSPLHCPASRWRAQPGERPRRGANSKKNVIGLLPKDWDERVWQMALEVWSAPEDLRELDALAVQLSVPVRPEELISGERAQGRSEGVLVVRRSARRLDITIFPAKSHNGLYGTEITTLKFDPVEAGGPLAHLSARSAAGGGRMVVSIRSKNASRKKLDRLGQIALPEHGVTITPYVCRNQVIADCKATLGSGVDVAGAAGQSTDRTPAKYGRVEHGRKRRGLIGVEYKRAPRGGNVARARELAAKRRTLKRLR